jgi:hypothetical protein
MNFSAWFHVGKVDVAVDMDLIDSECVTRQQNVSLYPEAVFFINSASSSHDQRSTNPKLALKLRITQR